MISRMRSLSERRLAAAKRVMPSIASARPTGPGSSRKRSWISASPVIARVRTARYTPRLRGEVVEEHPLPDAGAGTDLAGRPAKPARREHLLGRVENAAAGAPH